MGSSAAVHPQRMRALELVRNPVVLSNIEKHVQQRFHVPGAAPPPARMVTYIRTPSTGGGGARPLPTTTRTNRSSSQAQSLGLQPGQAQPFPTRQDQTGRSGTLAAPILPVRGPAQLQGPERGSSQAQPLLGHEGIYGQAQVLPQRTSFDQQRQRALSVPARGSQQEFPVQLLPVAVRGGAITPGQPEPCLCKAHLVYGQLVLLPDNMLPEEGEVFPIPGEATRPSVSQPLQEEGSAPAKKKSKKDPKKKLAKAKEKIEKHQWRNNLRLVAEIAFCVLLIFLLFYFFVPAPSFIKKPSRRSFGIADDYVDYDDPSARPTTTAEVY